ncbi:unnamed protein product [Linum tenue]|uniref:Chaperone DnaJ C-terminal domain-containing protein n=1 Tax=Linum tenue TaxID=586396 RepID=A0AAV0I681_9ROSI|nr:unnamed protein product [Linum tenue]
MVDDHHRHHNSESITIIGSSTTTTSDVDGKNPNNKNSTSSSSSSSSPSEKTRRRSKAKDFWRVHRTLIAKWCHAARNINTSSSTPTSPFSSPSPPPERPPGSSSPSTSSSCCSDGNKVGLGEGDDQPAPGLAPRVESQRAEEEEAAVEKNNTMNGIHSFRYTATAADPTTTTTTPKGVFKQKTKEADFLRTLTNPLSRIASKRSPSPKSSSKIGSRRSGSPLSFVHRCITGRKPTTTTTTTPPPPSTSDVHHDRSSSPASAAPPPPSTAPASLARDASVRSSGSSNLGGFSRNPSQRSTTPIMFSNSTGRKVKPPPVQQNLECTLEELFYGCTKTVKVTRDVLTDRGQIVQEDETLSIQVKPGWRRGTTITFEGTTTATTAGTTEPPPPPPRRRPVGSEPADVTFVIVEKRHPLFRRVGDDLEIAIGIPLVQALTGCDISIPLLGDSGEVMNLTIDDVIYPGYEKVIDGQGMPRFKEEGTTRGLLRVLFLVEFPAELTEEQKAEIVSILEEEEGE